MIVFVVFLAMLTLLLLVLLKASVPWWVKAGLIVSTFSFSFTLFFALDSYKGWAVAEPIPEPAQFVSCVVNEPTPGSHGAIFLWLIPLRRDHGVLTYRSSSNEPRAFRLPYSDSLSQACHQAAKKSAGGAATAIARSKAKGGAVHDPGRYHAYRLPQPNPPPKEHP